MEGYLHIHMHTCIYGGLYRVYRPKNAYRGKKGYVGIMERKWKLFFRASGLGEHYPNDGESNGKEPGRQNGNWGYVLI